MTYFSAPICSHLNFFSSYSAWLFFNMKNDFIVKKWCRCRCFESNLQTDFLYDIGIGNKELYCALDSMRSLHLQVLLWLTIVCRLLFMPREALRLKSFLNISVARKFRIS